MDFLTSGAKLRIQEAFHNHDGSINTARAAAFFSVSRRTIQHWIKTDAMPAMAIKLLNIYLRGYLPDTPDWRGFHIIGDKLHYWGLFGARELTARQLLALDYIFPRSGNEEFFLKFHKAGCKSQKKTIKSGH